jgi:hypothetical protein
MKQNWIAFSIITGILMFVGIIYYVSKPSQAYTDRLKIVKTWKLPYVLREVSGISHMNDTKIACIQDEEGIIFIYDLEQQQIVKEIEFGPRGDYESIRIIDSVAYVMESSGKIYKIIDFESEQRKIELYKTNFSSFNDMESLDFLEKQQVFLTVPKENNLLNNREKFIIYQLNPKDFKIKEKPFIALDYKDSIFNFKNSMLFKSEFLASELSIHPKTNEIYVLDSRIPKLLILNPDGSPQKLLKLNPENFQQPEGLSFDSKGRLYISNEENDFLDQNIQLVEWK